MGKHLSKRRQIGELAVMEETKPTGARTRTRTARRLALAALDGRRRSKKRKPTGEYHQISNLELRSCSVVLKPRIARSTANSGGRPNSSPELSGISRSSSDASCEAAETPFRSSELGQELDDATFFRCNGEREETTASSNDGDATSDLESTVEMDSRRRSTANATPSDAELEEFFAGAERDLRRRFVERYNFDVVKDVPLAGRYEWIPFNP
ncbi:hypothetical protein OPV22_034928 [Ensete ventricosum]|uniref:Cyclin-dependent kinase inhibitor n=1 Tax=Ensete ventricosum TaxID=4639 RepID=A0AAV8PMT9_ENSVE|nr:hypothetical protein OPV22_034928 [Ensete ventricosum]